MADDSGFDPEAELERELALLDSAGVLPGLEEQEGTWPELSADTGAESDEDGDADPEPESLRALRDAYQRRDLQCQQLLADFTASTQQLPLHLPANSTPQAQQDAQDASAPPAATATDSHTPSDTTEATARQDLEAPLPVAAVAEAVSALERIVSQSRPSTPLVPAEQVTGAREGDDAGARLGRVLQERQAARDAVLQEELAREAERVRRRDEERVRLEQEAAAAEAERVRAAEQLAADHAGQLSQLQALSESAHQEVERQRERAEAEQRRLHEEQQRIQTLLEQQAAAAKARQGALEAMEHEAAALIAQDARRHLAARRIGRAWRMYAHSPQRQERTALVTILQAAWRAKCARVAYQASQQRRAAENELVAAVVRQSPEALQSAADMARQTGLSTAEIEQRVSAARQQVTTAVSALQSAAAGGTGVAFRSALAAARALLPADAVDVRRAEEAFAARIEAAVAAAKHAVAEAPMQEVVKAVDTLTQLGVDPSMVTQLLETARTRDAQLAAQLTAAAATDTFEPAVFDSLAARASALGLRGDVAAAQTVLNKRKRQLLARLALGTQTNDVSTNQALVCDLRALGLASEADRLHQEVAARQEGTERALRTAAEFGTPDELAALLQTADTEGVSPSLQQHVQDVMKKRQQTANSDLMQAARGGTLVAYRRARRVALHCGAINSLETAERYFTERQENACKQLAHAVHSLNATVQQQADTSRTQPTPRLADRLIQATLGQLLSCDSPQLTSNPRVTGTACGLGTSQAQEPVRVLLHGVQGQQGVVSSWVCATAASQLPTEPPPCVLQGAQAVASSVLQGALQGVWTHAVSALQLGMQVPVQLSLGALYVMQRVQIAQGQRLVTALKTALGPDGQLLATLPWSLHTTLAPPLHHPASTQLLDSQLLDSTDDSPDSDHSDAQQARTGQQTHPTDSGGRGGPALPGIGTDAVVQGIQTDMATDHMVESDQQCIWLWPPMPADIRTHPHTDIPTLHDTSASHGGTSGATAVRRERPRSPPLVAGADGTREVAGVSGPVGVPLTRALLESVCGVGVGVGQCARVDLGLEQLGSVEGLGTWCPQLQVLLLPGNHLRSLSGCGDLHALTDLNARGNQITSLAGLTHRGQRKEHLWRLQLDSNKLTTLDGVETAPNLRHLSVSDNHLTTLSHLSHSNPSNGHTPILTTLAASCALLTTLDLAGNRLTTLTGLGNCQHLTHLDISRNALTTLHGLRRCMQLRTLRAAHNQLSHWPGSEFESLLLLQSVDLSSNQIGSWVNWAAGGENGGDGGRAAVGGQPGQPAAAAGAAGYAVHTQQLVLPASLHTLVLRSNRIPALPSLLHGPRLTHLDLAFNEISHVDSIRSLAGLSSVERLYFTDNPVAGEDGYKQCVQQAVPALCELDGQPVPAAERLRHVAAAALTSPVVAECAQLGSVHHGSWLGQGMDSVRAPATHAAAAAAAAAVQTRLAATAGPGPEAVSSAEQHVAVLQALAEGAARVQQQRLTAAAAATVALKSTNAGDASAAVCHTEDSAAVSNVLFCTLDMQHADETAARRARLSAPRTAGTVSDPLAHPTPSASAGAPHHHHHQHHETHSVQLSARPIVRRMQALAGSLSHALAGKKSPGAPPHVSQQSDVGSVHGGWGLHAQHADVAWSCYEQQYEDCAALLHKYHADQVAALCSQHTASGSQAVMSMDTGVLNVGEGFYAGRKAVMDGYARRIQAAWRAWQARRAAARLRSERHAAARQAAAVCIQAIWRGFAARKSPDLKARQRAAAARKEAERLLQEEARKASEAARFKACTAAAVTIQARVRGWLVRQRIKAAQQAARYQDDDEFDYGGVEDTFLADIESIMTKEHIQPPAQPHQPNQHQKESASAPADPKAAALALAAPPRPDLASAMPALVRAFAAKGGAAAMAAAARPAWPASDATAPGAGPPLRTVPHNPDKLLPPLSVDTSPTKDASGAAAHAGGMHGPKPPVLHVDVGQYEMRDDVSVQPDTPSKVSYAESITSAAAGGMSPDAQAAQLAARQQRHRERMEALMAEWGFQDIATAEAYWRRQQRQTQGDKRRKMEAKFKDPTQRLKKLQEAVEARPKLRPEDLQQRPAHGPEVQLRQGALQGPPSRESGLHAPHASPFRQGYGQGNHGNGGDASRDGLVSEASSGAWPPPRAALPPAGAPGKRHVSSADAAKEAAAAAAAADAQGGGAGPWLRRGSLPAPGAGARGSAAAQGLSAHGSASHTWRQQDDDSESVSGLSLASAASAPAHRADSVPDRGTASAGLKMPPLRKSASVVNAGKPPAGKSPGSLARSPVVVLPQVPGAPLANNWVLSGGGAGSSGGNTPESGQQGSRQGGLQSTASLGSLLTVSKARNA